MRLKLGRARDRSAATDQLADFARTRTGVEAFLEPRTALTPTTVLLVAGNGEWTRRPFADEKDAARFARRYALPLYDAARVGYPRRMREWNQRGR